MAESTRVKMQAGEQSLFSKLAEFDKAVRLIGRDICVSHANLSSGQHTEENRRLEFEVKKLLLKQKTDAEAEWVDPNSKDGLSEVGLKQLCDVKKAIKDLKGVQGTLEDFQKKSKSPPPKGEKTSELKRSASAEGTPVPKKRRQVGLPVPKPSPDATDPEAEIDAILPLKERLRSSPSRVTPPKPTAKGKGKGKGKGRSKAQGDKPDVARALETYPGDEPAATGGHD